MIFLLQQIEQNVPEEFLAEGEQMHANGQIRSLTELERHLWEAKVEDADRLLEVEVKISPSKILAASCECDTFQKEKMCPHLVAVMLELRKKRTTARLKAQKKKNSRTKKLTTGLVLNQIDPEELVEFVRQYAKTNRNFSIALKARFASTVDNMQSDEKYRQLLESTISASRKSDRSITLRGAQKISNVLKELLKTANRALFEKDFVETFTIARIIIERVGPVFRKVTSEKARLEPQLEQAFRLIDKTLDQQPAPALLQQIWSYCYEESQKLIYRSVGLDLEFLHFLHHLSDIPEKLEKVIDLSDRLLQKYDREQRNKTALLLFRYKLLKEAEMTAAAEELIKAHLREPDILLFAIERAADEGRLEQAKQLATTGLSMNHPPHINDQLEETLLNIAQKAKDTPGIIQYAEKRLLRSLQSRYFSALKGTKDKDWEEQVDQTLQKIQKVPFSKEKLDLIAHILLREQRLDQLKEHLAQSLSVDLLLEYGPHLETIGHQALFDLYQKLLHYYLRNHIGRKPSVKIRTAISQLHHFGLADLADQLVEEFRSNYGERHSLMEELDFF